MGKYVFSGVTSDLCESFVILKTHGVVCDQVRGDRHIRYTSTFIFLIECMDTYLYMYILIEVAISGEYLRQISK